MRYRKVVIFAKRSAFVPESIPQKIADYRLHFLSLISFFFNG